MRTAGKLTPQQELFAQQVALGKSQAEAYRQAYPRSRTWSPEAVYSKASALAGTGKVSTRVAELARAAAEAAGVDTAQVLRGLTKIACADPRLLIGDDGKMKTLQDLDDATAAAVASYEVDRFGKVKVKFWDKVAALDRLARHLGLYEKDHEQRTEPMRELAEAISGCVVGIGGLEFSDDDF